MEPSITALRRIWHKIGMGNDVEFWDVTPADFKFLIMMKTQLGQGPSMTRSSLSDLIHHFQKADNGGT